MSNFCFDCKKEIDIEKDVYAVLNVEDLGALKHCKECGERFRIPHWYNKEKMQVHTLKAWPEQFQAIWDGRKQWEYRNNDRDYKVGDVVVLQEWHPVAQTHTGRKITAEIVFMLKDGFGLVEGYVVFSLTNICRGRL